MFTEVTFQTSHTVYILNIETIIHVKGLCLLSQLQALIILLLPWAIIRKLLKLIRGITDVWYLPLNITVENRGRGWGRGIKQNWNSSQKSKLEVTDQTVPPEMLNSGFSRWTSSQRTMLILIHHNFFLAINEILKEKKKTQPNNKKPNPKKPPKLEKKNFKCHCIYKTQTTLFKFFLCVNYPSNTLPFMLT